MVLHAHRPRILQEGLRGPSGAAGVARQQHGFGNIARFCPDMNGHVTLPLARYDR